MAARQGSTAARTGLEEVGRTIQESVPDLVGLSVGVVDHGLSFTLAASDQQVALLDVLQHLGGGPAGRAVRDRTEVSMDRAAMHDRGWHLLSAGMASMGVAVALAVPLTVPVAGRAPVVGAVNLYAARRDAFDGLHGEVRRTCLEWAGRAAASVSLADLAACTTFAGPESPDVLRDAVVMDQALARLSGALAGSVDEARARLYSAAARGGLPPGRVAELVAGLLQRR